MVNKIQKPPPGYKRQRYAVYCIEGGKTKLLGSSHRSDGGIVKQLAKDDPGKTEIRVEDTELRGGIR